MTDMNTKKGSFIVEFFWLRMHIGVTWLKNWAGGERGQNRPWVLGTLIHEGVKSERGGGDGFTQSLLYIQPFSSVFRNFLFVLQLVSQKNILSVQNIEGAFPPLPPNSYTYETAYGTTKCETDPK
jgi:hypothetical protein